MEKVAKYQSHTTSHTVVSYPKAFVELFKTTVSCCAVKKTYSGKVGGRNDDVAIVMQLAITGQRQFYSSDKYNNFRGDVY